jgi:hypothetical protein
LIRPFRVCVSPARCRSTVAACESSGVHQRERAATRRVRRRCRSCRRSGWRIRLPPRLGARRGYGCAPQQSAPQEGFQISKSPLIAQGRQSQVLQSVSAANRTLWASTLRPAFEVQPNFRLPTKVKIGRLLVRGSHIFGSPGRPGVLRPRRHRTVQYFWPSPFLPRSRLRAVCSPSPPPNPCVPSSS